MKAAPNGTIRLALMNLEHDGGPEVEPGVLPDEWRTAFEDVLKPLQADWIGLTELTYSQTRPDATDEEKAAAARRWKAARRTLGMRGFRARMGQGRNPTGMLVRESTFTVGPQHHLDRVFRTPPTNVVLGLSEAPGVPIITAAFHIPRNTRIEALDPARPVDLEEWWGIARQWTTGNHVRGLAAFVGAGILIATLLG